MGAKRIAWVTFIRSVPPPPLSPRRSSSRDCRIVEGVRPFRRRLSSVKPFTRRRMPKREMHAWPVHLPTRGRCCARDRTCSVGHADPVAPGRTTLEAKRDVDSLTPSGSSRSSEQEDASSIALSSKFIRFERTAGTLHVSRPESAEISSSSFVIDVSSFDSWSFSAEHLRRSDGSCRYFSLE